MLLVGLCDSGKTLLFSRVSWSNTATFRSQDAQLVWDLWMVCLLHNALFVFWQLLSGKFKWTQTSITDSSAPYKVQNDRVSLRPFIAGHPLLSRSCHSRLFPRVLRAAPGRSSTCQDMIVFALSTWRSLSLQPGESKATHPNNKSSRATSDLTVCVSVLPPTSLERSCLWWTALSSRKRWEMWQSSCTSCWRTRWSPGMLRLSWWRVTNKVKMLLCSQRTYFCYRSHNL